VRISKPSALPAIDSNFSYGQSPGMNRVVMNIAQRNEILCHIRATPAVMLYVVQFEKLSGISCRSLFQCPAAFSTCKAIALKNFYSDLVIDLPVVWFCLPRMLQHVDSDR
jgi:hypothetical protein